MSIFDYDLISKAGISSISAFVEVMGGQPLDRWKVNRQLSVKDRLPFTNLIRLGPKNWYAGLNTCLIYGCGFYFPAIYGLENIWDKKYKKYKKNDKLDSIDSINSIDYINSVNKCLFVSSIISTGVSWFEGVKTDQQVNKLRHKNLLQITKMRYRKYGVIGIVPSYYSTFAREFCYCTGLLLLSPLIANRLETGNHYANHFIGGGIAGIISQTLSQPFDTIKTRQEKYKIPIHQAIRVIYKYEGVGAFWNGVLARCIRGMWSISCMSLMQHYLRTYLDSKA